jgi:ribosome-associated protein
MIVIPDHELEFQASRAGGPGGQHVNKTATRIEVRWNVRLSHAIDEEQRQRLLTRLASRLDGDGWLRVVAADTRSQLRNREAARERLTALVGKALVRPNQRRKTKTPAAERQKRLETKRRRGQLKATRRRVKTDE